MAFVVAARFRTPKRAQAIYTQVEQALYHGEPSDLSAYNIVLRRRAARGGARRTDLPPFVGPFILRIRPSMRLQGQLTRLLEHGQISELPTNVVATLRRRREQESGQGRWIEGPLSTRVATPRGAGQTGPRMIHTYAGPSHRTGAVSSWIDRKIVMFAGFGLNLSTDELIIGTAELTAESQGTGTPVVKTLGRRSCHLSESKLFWHCDILCATDQEQMI